MFYNCNPNRSNPECRSLAVFGEIRYIDSGFSSILFIVMCLFELTVLVSISLMVFLMLRIFWNSHSYHVNMMNIFKFFVSHIFIYTLSSIIILLYQMGFIEVTGTPTNSTDAILLLASVLRYYQLFGCVFMLATFLCERVAATVFIEDYEQKKRVHISLLPLLIVIFCSLFISIDVNFFPSLWLDWSVIIGSVLIVSTSYLFSALLFYRNVHLEKTLESKTDSYSLSVRFQLRENFRAFKLLRNITFSCAIGLLIAAVFMAIAVLNRSNKNVESLFGQAFNVFHSISFLFALLQCIWAEPRWQRQFKSLMGIPLNEINYDQYATHLDADSVRIAYFENLAASWNQKTVPVETSRRLSVYEHP